MAKKKRTARKKVSKKPRTKMPEVVKENRALTIQENKGGAPTKLTKEKIIFIMQSILMGADILVAVASAGFTKKTYYNYMNRGEQDPETYPLCAELLHSVQKALADADLRDLSIIDRAAQGMPYETTITTKKMVKDKKGKPQEVTETRTTTGKTFAWQAAAWKLERRNHQLYGKRDKMELSGEGGGPIKFAQENESEMREFLANEDNVIMLEKMADKWVEAKEKAVGEEESEDGIVSNQSQQS